MKAGSSDKPLLYIVIMLVSVGFIIFSSASLGLLAREGATFGAIAIKQLVFGLGIGGIALTILINTPYRFFRKYAFYFFFSALLLTCLVFVPGIGVTHNGASRWIEFANISIQPGEFLKVGFVIYFAAWLSAIKDRGQVLKLGVIPFIVLSIIVGAILLKQPDTDGFFIIGLTGFIMLMISGGSWKHALTFIILGIIATSLLFYTRPYIKERITTFYSPQSVDLLDSGYQINQSLIAIGSGGLTGRGFGQSVQKFEYLPEPIGDSIFAVAGEEFGFVGTFILLGLYVAFSLRGLKVAGGVKDSFGELLGVGLVLLITIQSFINIASMIALFPLSGTPLVFVSQGGTALMVALAEVGILLNISKHSKI